MISPLLMPDKNWYNPIVGLSPYENSTSSHCIYTHYLRTVSPVYPHDKLVDPHFWWNISNSSPIMVKYFYCFFISIDYSDYIQYSMHVIPVHMVYPHSIRMAIVHRRAIPICFAASLPDGLCGNGAQDPVHLVAASSWAETEISYFCWKPNKKENNIHDVHVYIYIYINRSIDLSIYLSIYRSIYIYICIHMYNWNFEVWFWNLVQTLAGNEL